MGNSCNYCEQYTRASSGVNVLKVIKPSNPFTNVCWVSVLTFSAPPQILAASTVFFAQFQKQEMMGDGFLGATAAGYLVLNSKRLLSIL